MPAGATYEPLATTTVTGSTTTTVTFSSLSAAYTDLVVVASIKGSIASTNIWFRVNNDSGTNYSTTYLEGDGVSVTSIRGSNTTRGTIGGSLSVNDTNYNAEVMHFMSYSNTTTNKTILHRFNSIGGTYPGVGANVTLWRSTSAINRIDFLTDTAGVYIAAGSTFTIYGIKAA